MKPIILWILYSCAILTNAHSQAPSSLTYLGIEHGLSNNAVNCIYQDHNGFMWFGTYDGLNRYDGYNFIVYRNELSDIGSLANNRVDCLTEDIHHRLWVGTRGGVCIYNNTNGQFSGLSYISGGIKRRITAPVNAIVATNGHMLIGTAEEGLFIYNGAGYATQVPLMNGDIHYNVAGITVDAGGHIWLFVCNVGLCRFDESSNTVYIINDNIRNGTALQADNNGCLWLGTGSGLYKYAIASNVYAGVVIGLSKPVVHLSIDKQHVLWVGTDGLGILTIKVDDAEIKKLAPPWNKALLTSTSVYTVFEDHDGRKWIGTLRGGINILDPRKTVLTAIRRDPLNSNSLIDDFTLSLCEDADHNIWIGTDGGGVSVWNRKMNRFTNFRHLSGKSSLLDGQFVTSIINDFQHSVWLTTWGDGIYRYDKKNNSFQHYACQNPFTGKEDKDTWVLYEDSRKELWAGVFTDGPLYFLNRTTNRFEVFDSTLTNILSIAEDRNGCLWAGDVSSLIKVDRSGKKHRKFRIGHFIRAIHEDKAGNFWIGTEGGGLLLFNRETGTYISFTKTNGLANNSVLEILEDKRGNLWISTFYGLSKFDPKKKTFRNFSQADGLLSNQLNYHSALALASGEFIFGGIRGLDIFFPDSLSYSSPLQNVVLTGLKIDNVPVESNGSYVTERVNDKVTALRIPYTKAVITVDFVAPEYAAANKIEYAYYMQGWDKGWNYAGKVRTANYTHLYEGNYTLRIKSTDTEGHWNKNEYVLRITVLPPWYRTWWACLIYLAIFIGLAYLYLNYRSQQIKLNFEIRLARMETEKEREVNEKKLTFFTNISHEFRTPLTLIINPVKEMLGSSDQHNGNKLDVIYRNARRLLSLVDQLLLFRKAESETDKLRITRLNLHNLCKEVFNCFSQQATAMNIQYTFSCVNRQIEIYADKEKMEIVLFNLLSNAMKFTPENGSVSLSVIENEHDITVIITDTGCGISEKSGQYLFEKFSQIKSGKTGFGIGLYLSKQFVESHKGHISFTSVPEQGTTFKILLQKGTAHFAGHFIFEDIVESPALLDELTGNIAIEIPSEGKPGPVIDIISEKHSLLVVDDNPEISRYLQQLFQDKFIFHAAENGEIGLQMAREHTPDVIISDVIMKGMNGVELCHAIKQDTALGHIPVVLLTANPSQETKLRSIECGADDYIVKPFEKELLIARIDNLLQNRNILQRYFFEKITLREDNTRIPAENKYFLERCINIVESNLNNDAFNIKMLATEIGMSHSALYKKVKSISGNSVSNFIRFIRLRRAAVLLLSTGCNVNEAAFGVGINNVKYFRRQFSKLFGMPPSTYIKKYRHAFNKDFNIITWD